MKIKSFDSMGTQWRITVWDDITPEEFAKFIDTAIAEATEFDNTYSRFKKDSFVWSIADTTGQIEVPRQFMEMLVWYYRGYLASGKKINPLVGNTIADLGYDDEYSLTQKEVVRKTPDLLHAMRIVDATHIELEEKCLFDFGAIGKGYFVDRLARLARRAGYKKFLVDGSGDTLYEGQGAPLSVGLEHPGDTAKVIGRITMYRGAMAASAINRRAWPGKDGKHHHHYIDPHSSGSVDGPIATWVIADECVLADWLASALFFASPEKLRAEGYEFEYCVLDKEYHVTASTGFDAEFY